ncbi:MAG TPA: DNA topoisomerase IB [Prosthecobacter sp.]|nr:DNA topoisomerase IB [Prosthecobacter sp.]
MADGSPQQEAREAGLRYTTDAKPGISRKRQGEAFVYQRPDGSEVTDEETLARIKSLAIPPAWTDVWICPHANGHVQATGRDARGRKQYRYHARWREQRDGNKFQRMIEFARALPKLRKRVDEDLKLQGMPREKVLATVVRLLEATLIRVGNDEYARHNNSYGLTTMRNRHVKVNGTRIGFTFKGKSGKKHEISVQDTKLARIVRRCQDIPGQELFGYEDEEGKPRDVTSQDVNDYLREVTGANFTAKDFRTWAGTVLAALALREFEEVSSQAQAKKNVVTAVEAVARMLGNTPAVCRKCYVHPEVLDSYLQGDTIETIQQKLKVKIDEELAELKPEEAAVLVLLQRRLRE